MSRSERLIRWLKHLPALGRARALVPPHVRTGLARRMGLGQPWAEPIDLTAYDAAAPPDQALGVWGYHTSEIGLGTAARRAARALRQVGVRCSSHDISLRERSSVETAIDPLTRRHASNLLFVNPPELMLLDQIVPRQVLHGTRRIGHWAWELPDFPAAWRPGFDRVDEVWAGTTFVRDCLQRATDKPVKMAPYCVPDRPHSDKSEARARLDLPGDAFLFLTTFDYSSTSARKNPAAVIEAFKAAFPDDGISSPHLLLKFHGEPPRGDERQALLAQIGDNRRLLAIGGVMDEDRYAALQDACDCFVSLHRSEGFGFNIAECMLAGKPVVATGYSGNMDFMTGDNSYPVAFRMVQVEDGAYPFSDRSVWAEPDRDAAVACLRQILSNPGDAARRAELGRRTVVEKYSLETVGAAMRGLL